MTNLPLFMVAMLAISAAACGSRTQATPTVPPGIHEGTIPADGDTLAYRLFLPERGRGEPPALLVLLHGCTQDGEDLAHGTRMDELAEEAGIAVLYPVQAPDAHPLRCWNWYLPEHQRRDSGEMGRLAALVDTVSSQIGSDPSRLYVAGISAGAAAALAFAANYPDRVAAVGVHSGLPFGVARTEEEALRAMQSGPGESATHLTQLVLEAMGARARPVPIVIFHGNGDPVVHPSNAEAVATQWLEIHERLAESLTSESASHEVGGRTVRVERFGDTQRPAVELWMVDGLGHAWSGGSPEGTYTDPAGPDASREILRFFLMHDLR